MVSLRDCNLRLLNCFLIIISPKERFLYSKDTSSF
nr:MAG TPA: Cytoplasmic dynein 1 intermediate chain 2 [Caudoviricetes sp.]